MIEKFGITYIGVEACIVLLAMCVGFYTITCNILALALWVRRKIEIVNQNKLIRKTNYDDVQKAWRAGLDFQTNGLDGDRLDNFYEREYTRKGQ